MPGLRLLRGLFRFRRSAVLRWSPGVWAVPSGAVVSVLPTATRAADLGGESLVGNSILGVDGCAAAVARLSSSAQERSALSPACSAAPPALARRSRCLPADQGDDAQPIGVPSGLSEIVRTGFGSGNSDVMPFGGPAGAAATSGVLIVAASAGVCRASRRWAQTPEAGC